MAGNQSRDGRDGLSRHHCEGREGENAETMQGGTIAPSLLKLRVADAENIYHCNDKRENDVWD